MVGFGKRYSRANILLIYMGVMKNLEETYISYANLLRIIAMGACSAYIVQTMDIFRAQEEANKKPKASKASKASREPEEPREKEAPKEECEDNIIYDEDKEAFRWSNQGDSVEGNADSPCECVCWRSLPPSRQRYNRVADTFDCSDEFCCRGNHLSYSRCHN